MVGVRPGTAASERQLVGRVRLGGYCLIPTRPMRLPAGSLKRTNRSPVGVGSFGVSMVPPLALTFAIAASRSPTPIYSTRTTTSHVPLTYTLFRDARYTYCSPITAFSGGGYHNAAVG